MEMVCFGMFKFNFLARMRQRREEAQKTKQLSAHEMKRAGAETSAGIQRTQEGFVKRVYDGTTAHLFYYDKTGKLLKKKKVPIGPSPH